MQTKLVLLVHAFILIRPAVLFCAESFAVTILLLITVEPKQCTIDGNFYGVGSGFGIVG